MKIYTQRNGLCLLVLCLFMVTTIAAGHAIEHSLEHTQHSWHSVEPDAAAVETAEADDALCGLCLLATSAAIGQDLPSLSSVFAEPLANGSNIAFTPHSGIRLRPQGRAPPPFPC